MKVLIVGGGLGGLCLANGLRKDGVEVRVFERHDIVDSEKGGYFTHLEGQGWRALQRCLGEEAGLTSCLPPRPLVLNGLFAILSSS